MTFLWDGVRGMAFMGGSWEGMHQRGCRWLRRLLVRKGGGGFSTHNKHLSVSYASVIQTLHFESYLENVFAYRCRR
jgi:hypothetical protein